MPDDHVIPLDQEENLDLVEPFLAEIMDALPGDQAALALIAAGLDILPAARCTACYADALMKVRAEVDRLLADVQAAEHVH